MAAPAASRLAQLIRPRIDLKASIAVPKKPSPDELRSFYFREIESICRGLVQSRKDGFYTGKVPLMTFAPAQEIEKGWEWRITGGLLSKPGGEDRGRLVITTEDRTVAVSVDGYLPWLPSDVYALTQKPFHRLITWLALRRLRRALGD